MIDVLSLALEPRRLRFLVGVAALLDDARNLVAEVPLDLLERRRARASSAFTTWPRSSGASCNSAAIACASDPPSLITRPATVSRCPTYGMSPPLRTWL
jgi:hypothetical protein